ncbi:MAG: cell wall hydrolase [Sphingosinicella sp.]|nr:cell wall hydrolase [Sphingosinicella sp.]
MFSIARATGYAVASLIVVASATLAGPSLAWEVDTASAIAPTYFDHSAAAPIDQTDTGAASSFASPPFDPNLTSAVAEHAVARVEGGTERETVSEDQGRSLADLVAAHARIDVSDRELECLAGAVYFESKGEPLKGQLAVAEVILNRAGSGRFPKSICGVVTQKSQFSFVRGGRIPSIPRRSEAWRKAVAIAHIATNDLAKGSVGEALFFHARYVSPGWRRLTRVASIGNHIFYR